MKWFCSPCIQDVSHFLDLNKAINIWVGLCINVVDCQNVICSNLAFCSQTCLRFEGFLDGHKDANISIWVSRETHELLQCLLVSFFVKLPKMPSSEAQSAQFIGALEFWQPLMDIEDTHRPLSEHFTPQFNSTLFHRFIELLLDSLEPRFWDCSRHHSCSLTSYSLVQKLRTKAKLSISFQVLRNDGVFLWYFHREFPSFIELFLIFMRLSSSHSFQSLRHTHTHTVRKRGGRPDRWAKIISLAFSC